eukprot:TRINITY_DN16442_c0_g1_i2.p1 TRINITY_DN16442_c0_g1~~TRINITY_DN16442_c0_g1_i2.p1  ORF type:complete len:553 (-),score=119.37 TRINITY_DN16442_c0_g1_i2:26-1684(-)
MEEHQEDPVLSRIGKFGRWQVKTISVVQLVGFFTAWQMLAVSFIVPEIEFWCSPPGLGRPVGEKLNWTSPGVVTNNKTSVDACLMYDYDYASTTLPAEVTQSPLAGCSRWDYDRKVYPETVVSEFNLVCGGDKWRSISQSVYMFGVMVGAVGSGILSDRFGRKKVTLAASFGIFVFGIGVAFSPSMAVFTFLRWCVAVCSISCFTCGYVYCMEIVGGNWSTYIGIGLEFPWALGYMSLPLVAWVFPAWSHLQLAISIPILLLTILLFIPGLVPESPRWLLVRGQTEQAEEILAKASQMNGNSMAMVNSETKPSKEVKNGGTSATLLDLFKTPCIRRSTLIMYYLWFTNSFVYYGLTLNSGSLIPGDLHINFVIGGALEILAYALTILAFLYAGRRISMSVSMLFGGVALLITPVVSSISVKAVLAQLGKFAITGSFAMVYLYAAEIFPTVVRNVGVGSASMCARVGSIIAPYIGRELGRSSPAAPVIIFGVTSVLAGLVVLLLPETRNTKLPDTIMQGEEFNREFGGLAGLKRKMEKVQPTQTFSQDINLTD